MASRGHQYIYFSALLMLSPAPQGTMGPFVKNSPRQAVERAEQRVSLTTSRPRRPSVLRGASAYRRDTKLRGKREENCPPTLIHTPRSREGHHKHRVYSNVHRHSPSSDKKKVLRCLKFNFSSKPKKKAGGDVE